MKRSVLIGFVAVLAFVNAQQPLDEKPNRRSYVCPPNFIRLGHRCYFFSKKAATWQDAFFQCRDLHSNLAIIRNANQDKMIRKTLNKKNLVPLERWLGGLYDWEQMVWKWAASGKSITYQGFSRMGTEDKEKLRWHCIVMDPNLQYKWNSRSCVEQKNFICHTKIKIVTNKGKKKLLRQYNVSKNNQLNEIPVPTIPGDVNNNPTRLKEHQPNGINVNNAEYAMRTKERRRKNRRKKKKKGLIYNNINNTLPEESILNDERARSNFTMEHMKWKTYYKETRLNPLHPKAIVEEFNYAKEP